MTRRFFPPVLYPEGPPMTALDYRYWQARRCGWDAMSAEMRRNARGEPCHPKDSLFWHWWAIVLHWKQRSSMVGMSSIRLVRHVR